MLKIENANYVSNEKNILNNINLFIEKGESIALIGQSGSGKSSVLKILSGLIPFFSDKEQYSGKMFYKDAEVNEKNYETFIKEIGIVFQDPKSQFFTSKVQDELAFELENYGVGRQTILDRISEVASFFKISSLLDHDLDKLSSGQKQRIAISTALINDPEIIILDEPSSNLDLSGTNLLKEHLIDLKNEGKTIILAEHRLYYLMDFVDRFIYLNKGEIVREFTREELNELSDKEREMMGLRQLSLSHISNKNGNKEYMDHPYLEYEKIDVGYKRKILINSINFQQRQSEVIAIVGENGVGKTTFAKSLLGLSEFKSGNILLEQKKLNKKMRLDSVWMIMQDTIYQIFGDSCSNELLIGKQNTTDKKIEELLKTFDLWHVKDTHPYNLSGGERQRLVIAIGILQNKKIVLFDEPTSGLDGKNMLKVANLIKELACDHYVLVITHDPELIMEACDRLILLNNNGVAVDKRVQNIDSIFLEQLLTF